MVAGGSFQNAENYSLHLILDRRHHNINDVLTFNEEIIELCHVATVESCKETKNCEDHFINAANDSNSRDKDFIVKIFYDFF